MSEIKSTKTKNKETKTAQQRQTTASPSRNGSSRRLSLTATTTTAQRRHITKLTTLETVSIGTLTASLVHPREFFKAALLNCAAGVIAVHNHPSQDLRPSPEDRETTRRLKSAGELLGVPLLDHLIVGDGGFYSFREAGIL